MEYIYLLCRDPYIYVQQNFDDNNVIITITTTTNNNNNGDVPSPCLGTCSPMLVGT